MLPSLSDGENNVKNPKNTNPYTFTGLLNHGIRYSVFTRYTLQVGWSAFPSGLFPTALVYLAKHVTYGRQT